MGSWQMEKGLWAVEGDIQKNGAAGKVLSTSPTPVVGLTGVALLVSATFSPHLRLSADVRLVQKLPYQHRGVLVILPDRSKRWEFHYRGDSVHLSLTKNDSLVLAEKAVSVSEVLSTGWENLSLEVSGEKLRGYRNGVLEVEATDRDLVSAKTLLVGLEAHGSHSHFDNVEVLTYPRP